MPDSIDEERPLEDLESQRLHPGPNDATAPAQPAPGVETEYQVPLAKKLSFLTLWFLCNLTLTIYNKVILGKFSFPWLLTAVHTGTSALGAYIFLLRGSFSTTRLNLREELTLLAFSILFTVNIAISNVSLNVVSIPFHQIMRSTIPVFTVLIYRFRYDRVYSFQTYLSLGPVMLGAGLSTYGDFYFTLGGFLLTMLGVVLAAVKTVATNRIMTGSLKLSPWETLRRMSPLACVQALLIAFLTGEMGEFLKQHPVQQWTQPDEIMLFWILLGNGLIAFLLNISSFTTNKYAGALTMTVCGNVKQCLTVLLGIGLFGVVVGVVNGMGMLIALGGAAWYSYVELAAKQSRK